MTAYEVLDSLSSAFWFKQMYFLQNDGRIYSRFSGTTLSLEDAVKEFRQVINED